MKKLGIAILLAVSLALVLLVTQAVAPVRWTGEVTVQSPSLVICGPLIFSHQLEPGDSAEIDICVENVTGGAVLVRFYATADPDVSVWAADGVYDHNLGPGVHHFPWGVTLAEGATTPQTWEILCDDAP